MFVPQSLRSHQSFESPRKTLATKLGTPVVEHYIWWNVDKIMY